MTDVTPISDDDVIRADFPDRVTVLGAVPPRKPNHFTTKMLTTQLQLRRTKMSAVFAY